MSLANYLPKGFSASTYTSASAPTPRVNTPLPAGTYTVEITNAEIRPLKSGRGDGLTLEFTVIDPVQHASRKVWQTLNIKHENETTQDIALSQLSSLCKAVNLDAPSEDDLFRQVLRIRTIVAPGTNGYEPRAEVKGYEAAGVKLAAPAAPAKPKPLPVRAPAPAPSMSAKDLADIENDVAF